MTRIFDLTPISRASVGFDKIFNDLEKQFLNGTANVPNYPPYNIAEVNENEWIVSIAVAGFTMENLDITLDKDVLLIEGTAPKVLDEVKYIHKGIAGRSFHREFKLAEYVEVVHASLELGLLNIHLKRNVPEALQPKKIEITHKPEYTLIQN